MRDEWRRERTKLHLSNRILFWLFFENHAVGSRENDPIQSPSRAIWLCLCLRYILNHRHFVKHVNHFTSHFHLSRSSLDTQHGFSHRMRKFWVLSREKSQVVKEKFKDSIQADQLRENKDFFDFFLHIMEMAKKERKFIMEISTLLIVNGNFKKIYAKSYFLLVKKNDWREREIAM